VESAEKLKKIFISEYNEEPVIYSTAPGRVNLIGEHTDYNQGFVLPAALKFDIAIMASPSKNDIINIYSVNYKNRDFFHIYNHEKSKKKPWSNYIKGVLIEFLKKNYKLSGFKAVIYGNVPIGSGLSSSAALEVATAYMICKLFSIKINKQDLALLCQRAENNFVGVKCGIMDQYISIFGEKDHALFLDCRDVSHKMIPFKSKNYSIAICDSKAPRHLASSAYNQRRKECDEGVKRIKKFYPHINSLRDVSTSMFNKMKDEIPDPIRKRCLHVISENERTINATTSLKEKNFIKFGNLMKESHDSLKNDYEVSSDYLDCLVKAAIEGDECIGSRLTGAGFGGCTVNIVHIDGLSSFSKRVKTIYEREMKRKPEIYISRASRGAKAEWLKS